MPIITALPTVERSAPAGATVATYRIINADGTINNAPTQVEIDAALALACPCVPTVFPPVLTTYTVPDVIPVVAPMQAWVFPLYPVIGDLITGVTNVDDLSIRFIEYNGVTMGTNLLLGGGGGGTFEPLAWAQAQTVVDALLAYHALPAGTITLGNDGNGQPLVVADPTYLNLNPYIMSFGFTDGMSSFTTEATTAYAGGAFLSTSTCRLIKTMDTLTCDVPPKLTVAGFEIDGAPIIDFDADYLPQDCPAPAAPAGNFVTFGC